MKRKSRKPSQENVQASYILNKIDDACMSLAKNEDELSKVLAELSKRNLSEKEQDAIKSMFNSYSKNAKAVKDIIEN